MPQTDSEKFARHGDGYDRRRLTDIHHDLKAASCGSIVSLIKVAAFSFAIA
jgi:hypothetical protein